MNLDTRLSEADIFLLVRALSTFQASALYVFESGSDQGFKDLKQRVEAAREKLIAQLGDINAREQHAAAVNRGIDEALKVFP